MYVPSFTAIGDDQARTIVDEVGAGWLTTASGDTPPEATLLPVLWNGNRLIAHIAKANQHWRRITDGMPALMIVAGPQAYISPNWYPSKVEHGKTVPTWNYTAVHITGTLTVHHDSPWLLEAVASLTDRHEHQRPQPWHVTDAPDDYITTQLKAIVGIQMDIQTVEGKAKLSQNRSEEDQRGAISGLNQQPDLADSRAVAHAMQTHLSELRSADPDMK
jgi:transcriptional regulator